MEKMTERLVYEPDKKQEQINYTELIQNNRATLKKYIMLTRNYSEEEADLLLDMCAMFNINPGALTFNRTDESNLNVTISYQYLLSKVLSSGVIEYIEININKDASKIIDGECIVKRKDMSKDFKISLKFSEVQRNSKVWVKEPLSMFRKTLLLTAIKIICADIIEKYSLFYSVSARKESQQANQSYQQKTGYYQKNNVTKQEEKVNNQPNKSQTAINYTSLIRGLVDYFPSEEIFKKIGAKVQSYVTSKDKNLSNEEIAKKIYVIMYNIYKNAVDGVVEYEDVLNDKVDVADFEE